MKPAQKRKALYVILAVSALTLYNILPTLFFYSNNLNAPIGKAKALTESKNIAKRVNKLENETVKWIESYCNLLHIKSPKISFTKKDPDLVNVSFSAEKEARTFRTHMTKAGTLIPFFPKRIVPYETTSTGERTISEIVDNKTVILKREIPIHFDTDKVEEYFSFVEMQDSEGSFTSEYRNILDDRVFELTTAATSVSKETQNMEKTFGNLSAAQKTPFFLSISESILSYKTLFSDNSHLLESFYASIFRSHRYSAQELYNSCVKGIQSSKDNLIQEKVTLKETIAKQEMDTADGTIAEISRLRTLTRHEETLLNALTLLQAKKSIFVKERIFKVKSEILAELRNKKIEKQNVFTLSTGESNPIISDIAVNYPEHTVLIQVAPELLAYSEKQSDTKKQKIYQLIYDEIAKIKGITSEEIQKNGSIFTLNLAGLQDASSLLKFNLKKVAEEKLSSLEKSLKRYWKRNSESLNTENYKIISWDAYSKLSEQDKHFKLALYSPVLENSSAPAGFKNSSIYVIGKDLLTLYDSLTSENQMEEGENVHGDLMSLGSLLRQSSARTFLGNSYPFGDEFKGDLIYEIPDFAGSLLAATREEWTVTGGGKYAILELSDRRNRILTLNEIENREHSDLLKWKDDYNQSAANPKSEGHMMIPAPTKSAFFSNLALSWTKYFRGDERKILHWGLDLAGGTTVRVALKDKQNNIVTKEADLNQGINELYRRVNKMGVSDVTIRKEGSHITLDFPATQSLSASELITSSSMTFHIVNEKFSPYNRDIGTSIARFLQEVWNEALVTNRTDSESINKIAFTHLYGDSQEEAAHLPRSDAGRVLLDNGLTLADPVNSIMTSEINDTISKIGVLEGDSYRDWQGSSNPLVVIFNNYALEGASLKEVNSGYDPSSGNYLSFTINSSIAGKAESPRETLHNWTSLFATSQLTEEKYSKYTGGQGWRLSAILNGKIISMPRLADALKDSGRITGSFTQKEVSRLAADLRAGSLTYTPEIVSEESISPDLGQKERSQGIFAMGVAFAAVLALMIGYYRFAGVIASIAVIFNILIIWAVLQNLGAALTLPGIAGIILTIGMAVDANVLIFERIREELDAHGDLGRAISEGYKKAFTAIVDSNITTIIAAMILLNFDAGPVKGFALTLIIGIVSSMFTALYMTRTFFNYWYKAGRGQTLKMANLIPNTGISFMKYGKVATGVAMVMMIVGGITLFEQRKTLFGMDFTGGMSLQVEVAGNTAEHSAKELVYDAFTSAGISSSEFTIRELKNSGTLKIYLSNALNNPGRIFSDLGKGADADAVTYSFEKNPKLSYIVTMLNKKGITLTEKSMSTLDKNFSNISGQMSETMRNNAFYGLVLALLAILVYITIRFEFTYAISATIGLGFDLLLTLAVLGIFKLFGLPLSIDLNTVAALMTIIGYSLNDTIIVFDRIRSDLKVKKTTNFKDIINLSLNRTLSRTIMTSLTTLVVLLSLVILGGKSIFNFSFLMTMGVIIGTLSTLFIASTFLLLFKGKEKKKAHSSSTIISINS
jgi:SecD/SecF fusion protein